MILYFLCFQAQNMNKGCITKSLSQASHKGTHNPLGTQASIFMK